MPKWSHHDRSACSTVKQHDNAHVQQHVSPVVHTTPRMHWGCAVLMCGGGGGE